LGLAYDPWTHAEGLGLTVVVASLPDQWRGGYEHECSRILLSKELSLREARSTLTHEIQHALAGDTPTLFGFISAKQERLADQRTAIRLVDLDEYLRAEDQFGGHTASIANYLNVTAKVVKDWRRLRVVKSDLSF
jgi:Zn-dependent peptidase ImmA (M78 family)